MGSSISCGLARPRSLVVGKPIRVTARQARAWNGALQIMGRAIPFGFNSETIVTYLPSDGHGEKTRKEEIEKPPGFYVCPGTKVLSLG